MKTVVSVTYDCERGYLTLTALSSVITVGFHWKPWDSATGLYYNGSIRLDHADEDIQKALLQHTVWVSDPEREELSAALVQSTGLVWELARSLD